jgi:hypothetical protein
MANGRTVRISGGSDVVHNNFSGLIHAIRPLLTITRRRTKPSASSSRTQEMGARYQADSRRVLKRLAME